MMKISPSSAVTTSIDISLKIMKDGARGVDITKRRFQYSARGNASVDTKYDSIDYTFTIDWISLQLMSTLPKHIYMSII